MAESVDLTEEQTEKLLHFQELIGIDNLDECRQLLIDSRWDLEIAVQSMLSRRDGRQSAFHEPPRSNQREPQVNVDPADNRTLTVERAAPQGIVGWVVFLVKLPYYFVYSVIISLFRFLYSFVRPDPRLTVTDPRGDVMAFINGFNERYGPACPNFYQGTYGEAVTVAKQDLLFMLVYLHDDNEPATHDFCRLVLCDPRVVNLTSTRTIFWGCSINSPEGYRVSKALKATRYPFLGVIVLRNGRMTVVQRIQGPIGAHDLLPTLARVFDHSEDSLEAVRRERLQQFLNQNLRQEQDEAYQASLRADQEKERLKQEVQEQERRIAEEERNKDLEQQRHLESIKRRKEEIRELLPTEPGPNDPDAIKILLKLPNGVRLERRFYRTDSLAILYNYLFVHEAAPDDFQVVTNFPRRTLPCQPTEGNPNPPTFEEAGIQKAEMLFVHDNQA